MTLTVRGPWEGVWGYGLWSADLHMKGILTGKMFVICRN